MYLHKNLLYYISFISIYLTLSTAIHNENLLVTKTGIEDMSPDSVGLRFFSVLNNTSDEDFYVELLSDECCIKSGEDLDCDSFEIIGESCEVIEKGKVRKFTLVAPVLDPFERKGYCIIHVDSRPLDKRNNIMRDTIKIDFDTRLEKKNLNTNLIKKIEYENKDETSTIVDNKAESFNIGNNEGLNYEKNMRRSVKQLHNNLNETRLDDPRLHRCINSENMIENDDIDFIKSLSKERQPKDIIIVEENSNPNGTLSQHFLEHNKVLLFKNETNNKTEVVKKKVGCWIQKYLTANKYTLIVLGMVIFIQCFLICTMIGCLTQRSRGSEKKVESKYFNYRQDVSVTTPLIATSNIDTETAEFDYISESSNIDKKIKCYKACQKERNKDTKTCMSDDILTKCLNRRNWNTTTKSDSNGAVNNCYNNCANVEWNTNRTKIHEMPIPECDTAAVKSERTKKESALKVSNTNNVKDDYNESESSEKLIQCHDYNVNEARGNVVTERCHVKKGTASCSTEKEAQACFSNDSIDDFLSERGMVFLAGENLSKYSFASNSSPKSSTTSKTSKNNIVKNVMSYLSRKSKTSSDPGIKKSKSKDLELIHMSKASMFSSSASDYKKSKGGRLGRDSVSSF